MKALYQPLAACIGLRWTRAKRRNHFISFVASSSMVGVALGVTAIITILSVMNGFEAELRHRILGMTAQVYIEGAADGWAAVGEQVRHAPGVLGVAPYVHAEAMIVHDGYVNGMVVQGLDPGREAAVSFIGEKFVGGRLGDLLPGRFGIVLGVALARSLHADLGDQVLVISPQPTPTPAGILPRSRRCTVVGLFEIGMQEYDTALGIMQIDDAARLFRTGAGVTGLRLKLADELSAPMVRKALQAELGARYAVSDWTEQHVSFFHALKTEKIMMFLILSLVVAVAAFNIVSSLVMVVTDKQADIAILRTLGASPRQVMAVFIVQGLAIGVMGTGIGVLAGTLLGLRLPAMLAWAEQHGGFRLMSCDVYYICELPSELHRSDVWLTAAVAFALCALATIYPAWRAARTPPAAALRYE